MTVTAAPIAPDEPPSPWGKRVVVAAVVVGAVALADAIVDELLPAA